MKVLLDAKNKLLRVRESSYIRARGRLSTIEGRITVLKDELVKSENHDSGLSTGNRLFL